MAECPLASTRDDCNGRTKSSPSARKSPRRSPMPLHAAQLMPQILDPTVLLAGGGGVALHVMGAAAESRFLGGPCQVVVGAVRRRWSTDWRRLRAHGLLFGYSLATLRLLFGFSDSLTHSPCRAPRHARTHSPHDTRGVICTRYARGMHDAHCALRITAHCALRTAHAGTFATVLGRVPGSL